MTDAATHTDTGMPIVTLADMAQAVTLTLSPGAHMGPELLKVYESLMDENPVMLCNMVSAVDAMSRARNTEVAGAFLVGFVQCYVALRNAETRYRKG